MNIYHLQYFVDAAKYKSITKAAERNYVSHSAISQAIKSLESYLNIPLLHHSKRKFQLTPEGILFCEDGQKILASIQESKQKLRERTNEPQGDFTLWAPQSLIVDSLYKTIAEYRKKYPKVFITLKTAAAAQVREAVKTGEVHLGILIDDGLTKSFEKKLIRSGEFVLISRSKPARLDSNALIITGHDKIEVMHLMKKYKLKYKKDLKVEMEVMSWGLIKNLVLQRIGIGYVPDYCVGEELEAEKLFVLPPPGNAFKYSLVSIWPRGSVLNKNAKLFLDLLQINQN